MGWLDVERKVQTHIVRYTVGVAVCIIWHIALTMRVQVLAGRERHRTACGIVEVAGETVSFSKRIVEHSLALMRSVIFRRIPLTVVQRHCHPLVILTEQRA